VALPVVSRGLDWVLGTLAAFFWVLTCVSWFDAGAPYRGAWLSAIPAWALAAPTLILGVVWLSRRWRVFFPPLGDEAQRLWLVVGLALLFRLPLAWQGAAAYTTADGALSGIVALHVRHGIDHPVFIPHLPYSGSLKSHLTAALALLMETPRAFTLMSVLFYTLFVSALYRLALLADSNPFTALGAGFYAAFSPAFVTHYSLSNDGNYVEVLALGTWALLLAVRWWAEEDVRSPLALGAGLLLGLSFWCHLVSVVHLATIGLVMISAGGKRVLGSLFRLAVGFVLGFTPGLLWNAGNDWDSFRYVIPGAHSMRGLEAGPGVLERARLMATEQWPILLGYDPGYARWADFLMLALSLVALGTAFFAVASAVRRPNRVLGVLIAFMALNLVVATVALPHVPSNPRYILFLVAPLSILLARFLARRSRRWLLVALVAFGALGSLAQGETKLPEDERWRTFVSDLEKEGVHWCYTDFYLATKINFLSEGHVVCSAKLGPTVTEYFFEYRREVEAAPEAALIAVSAANADKLERRLSRLGVSYERRNLMKPVLLRLSRKVDPAELFPDRAFPMR
jgi:hypothetical protein